VVKFKPLKTYRLGLEGLHPAARLAPQAQAHLPAGKKAVTRVEVMGNQQLATRL
jgi:hypothetical protein